MWLARWISFVKPKTIEKETNKSSIDHSVKFFVGEFQ